MRPRRAAVVAVALLVVGIAAAPAAAIDVGGDDAADGYVASGSLVLDETFDGDARARAAAASCPGCRWTFEPYCRTMPQPGGWDTCPATVQWCPVGTSRVRLLRWTPERPWWEIVGSTCVGAGRGPVPVASIAAELRDVVMRLLPPLRPTTSPAGVTLAGLPTYLDSGQPPAFGPARLDVLGVPVHLVATPRWTWDVGDGDPVTTDDPGGPWPTGRLTHRFRGAGPQPVVVTTTWTARFTAAGLGPYDVEGPPVTQQASLPLEIREARAVLVPR